jgi:hypothetical protein
MNLSIKIMAVKRLRDAALSREGMKESLLNTRAKKRNEKEEEKRIRHLKVAAAGVLINLK